MEIKIKRINDEATIPIQGSEDAAGFDLCSLEDTTIWPHRVKHFAVGLAIELPRGYEGQVRSRSGHAKRGLVVANSPGTVDADYRGELGVLLLNTSDRSMVIRKGERIAQLVINQVPSVQLVEVDTLSESDRGSGGFGSTGK